MRLPAGAIGKKKKNARALYLDLTPATKVDIDCKGPLCTGTCHIFAPCFVSSPPLHLLNHGVFWSDIWTQYSFLQFRKIILMPKWRNRSLTAMMCKLSNVISNHHNKPKTADFLRLGGPKHDTCWYWLAQGFTSFFSPMRTERVKARHA